LAAALALTGCDRGDRGDTTARTDTGAAAGSTSRSATARTAPSTGTAATDSTSTSGTSAAGQSRSTSGAGTAAAPGATSTGAGATATGALPAADQQFVAKAAQGGQFEVEIAKLAADKASDPQVKSFAQMLVDDHTAANDKLRQIASSHNVPLPAALPADKKKEIDQLGKLSGADFDRQFVKTVGIKDHHHDIDEFEKAAKSAKSDDVRDFAQSTLPTLKKHLAAAEKLPMGGGKAKG
jgi:putative membrane protein